MRDLLSQDEGIRQNTIENLQEPSQLASDKTPVPLAREPVNHDNSKPGPIALTDRVNFYYSAADVAKKEAELSEKQKRYEKGLISEGELQLARTMLESSKNMAQSIEKALLTLSRVAPTMEARSTWVRGISI